MNLGRRAKITKLHIFMLLVLGPAATALDAVDLDEKAQRIVPDPVAEIVCIDGQLDRAGLGPDPRPEPPA